MIDMKVCGAFSFIVRKLPEMGDWLQYTYNIIEIAVC